MQWHFKKVMERKNACPEILLSFPSDFLKVSYISEFQSKGFFYRVAELLSLSQVDQVMGQVFP